MCLTTFLKNDNFSNMVVSTSFGIQDHMVNNLMAELITEKSQRSNHNKNNQQKNPTVKKLNIKFRKC